MKVRRIAYTAAARADVDRIQTWLSEKASPVSAYAVTTRILDFIDGLAIGSMRGQAREDLRPGLRVVPFERAVIAFAVHADTVSILRIFYGGEDWETAFARESD